MDNPENYFYLIRTRIKLFDDLGEKDNNIKQKIFLFDFPGFENDDEFQEFIGKNILKKFHFFIFVLRESFIDEKNYRNILAYTFNQAMEKKRKFFRGFIEYCLFILNLDKKEQKIDDTLINSYKNQIKSIIDFPDDVNIDINFFSLNAKSFYTDNKSHNYFFNIKDTINASFKTYCKIKNTAFKYPENYNEWDKIKKTNIYSKKYDSFQKYFTNKIYDDLKSTFESTPKKSQAIDDNVKNIIDESLKELEMPHYNIKIDLNDKNKKILYAYFSFAQSKISYESILSKYNCSAFNNMFMNLIKNTNNELHLSFKTNIDNINNKLSMIFNPNLIKRKKEDYNNFQKEIDTLIYKIKFFLNDQINQIKQKEINCQSNIISILESKKQAIINRKLKGNSDVFKNIILNDIIKGLNKLNDFISEIFQNITISGNVLFAEIRNKLNKFLDLEDEKKNLEDFINFEEFFYSKVFNERNIDINQEKRRIVEITKEIQRYFNNSISKIFDERGFLESFKSIFSRHSYYENFIEMIKKYILERINYITLLLSSNLKVYTKDKIDLIKFRVDLYATSHTDNEIKKIEELSLEWNKIKDLNSLLISLV